MSEELEPEVIEERARNLGWTPQEEFRGDPEKWISADKFLERGEKELPLAKANNERLHNEIAAQRNEISEMKETFKEFKEFSEKSAQKAEKRGYEQAKKELETKRRAAVEEGDTEKYDKVTSEIEDLDKTYKTETKETVNKNDQPANPYYDQFVVENKWYSEDDDLKALADNIGGYVLQTQPGLYGKAFFDKVVEEVKIARPNKFQNPNRDLPGDVEDGGYQGKPKTKRKTYDNLPKDAQEACERFIRQGLVKDKDEYLKNYDWE